MQFKKKGGLHKTLTNICKICESSRISEENPRKRKIFANSTVIFEEFVFLHIVELSLNVTPPSEEYPNYQCREILQDVYRSINWPEPAYSFLLCIKYAFQRQ